jgi:uroporphyrinogen-III synthase
MLAARGADVVSLTVYRWGSTKDPAGLRRSVELTGQGAVDAVVFTSAPGAAAGLGRTGDRGPPP